MKKLRKLAFLLAFLLIMGSFNFSIYGDDTSSETKTEKEIFDEKVEFLKNVIEFVKSEYQYEINYEDVINGMYDGFFDVLDKYSIHYTAEEYEKFNTDLAGEYNGIGIYFTEYDGYIKVVSPLQNSPALKAGLKPNDIIVSVDGNDIKGLTSKEVKKAIRGELGTTVKIGIKRDGKSLLFDVLRDKILLNSVSSKILENNKGYLRISQFNHNTCELIEKELEKFDEAKVTDLVVDLRNNPGGSLEGVIKILNLFVPEGPIVCVNYDKDQEKIHKSKLKEAKYKLAVIVNKGSASASELFAGAIQDRKVGKIIGTTTYGKGVVQTLYPLVNGHAVKFTTAEYFTPNKNKVQGVGITPDIVCENTVITPIDLTDIPKLKKERKAEVGIIGLDVLGTEMILEALGYKVNEPDGIFDNVTHEQLKQFQIDKGLFGYGILDFSTQDALTSAITEFAKPIVKDTQLEEALKTFDN